ncbi:hypothetical protein [uncultured Croceitalea sp.]|uniref:hypothetical protein n=1 Tax=uncultured Croceitalea sp. TaxID=1798908 RepID=UPI003306416B
MSKMDIKENWRYIKKHFYISFRQNLHVIFASVDAQNNPVATPIGTLFFNKNQTGFYFEKFVTNLPNNRGHNSNICVLAVNSNKLMWIKALFRGYFSKYPGLKLYGELGDRREATAIEMQRLNRRMKTTKGLKGNTYLWGDMKYIREITFTRVEKISLGRMTQNI